MKTISDHALAAKNIRKELKALSPKTKFSVTSSSFSMGDSVHAEYTDGPAWTKANEIVKKYEYGDFDGMVDLYSNKKNFDGSKGSTKYATVSRSLSPEFILRVAKTLKIEVVFGEYGRWDTKNECDHCKLSRAMEQTDF